MWTPCLTRFTAKLGVERYLPSVILIWPHRPRPLLMAGRVGAVGLGRVAVDQRPHEHRVRGAADLVLDGEQMPAAVEVDDVAKAVLILVVFLRDQAALPQAAVGTRKIRDVDLHVMPVELRLRAVSLA